jgi:hypothetical protein
MKDETEKIRTDALMLLRAIDATQADGQGGARIDPPRAGQDIGLEVGSERYHEALWYLIDKGALVGDEHTATEAAPHQPHGYAAYFFTERALELLREG